MLVLWIKFAKLLSVTLYLSGSLGAVFARDLEDRQRFAYQLAGPGFGLTWLLGFVLAGLMGQSYLATWILGALALSFASLQGPLFAVGRVGRRTVLSSLVILGPLVATVGLMVFKPS